MATNGNSAAQEQAVSDLKNRVEWLDDERRKLTRKLAELEQKLSLQEREIDGREQRIQDLERQLAGATAQLTRLPQIDNQLAQFKDDIVQMIEQYDQRRVKSETEMDRLRRIEQESTAREITEFRKELSKLNRLQTDMDLRVAEETRLANLLSMQKSQIDALKGQIENWESTYAFMQEKEVHNNRNISDLQTGMVEINKRWETLHSQFDAINSKLMRHESSVQAVSENQDAIQESTKNWMEQLQLGEYERNQKMDKWRRLLDEHTEAIEHFNKEWIQFSDQFKEAKMAVQTLSEWQTQIEKQQREAAELLRVESGRLQSRWDDFLSENDKKWTSYDVDAEQRWGTMNRHQRQILEQLALIEEALKHLEQEKDLIWRVQAAQADALKQLPRLWVEEVDKAIAQNPNRRRQPALVPVREEYD